MIVNHRVVTHGPGGPVTINAAVHPGPVEGALGVEPTVLLHGFTGSAATMDGLARVLSGSRTVVAVDLVGHGLSDAPADVEAYRMEACVAQVLDVVGQLVDGAVDLVGYSMGGRVALSLAAEVPGPLRSVVLVGASAGLATPDEAAARREADTGLAESIGSDGLEAFVDRWMALPMWASLRDALGPDSWADSRRQRLTNDPMGLALSLRGMGSGAQSPVHDRLPTLGLPVLVMAGELDTKFAGIARELVEALPRARLALVPDAGHAAHTERPKLVADLITDFLDGLDD